MGKQSLVLSGIAKSFGAEDVLKAIDLDIRPGEFLSLVGSSGCGKSTLLRIIAGLETPDRGVISIGGRDMTGIDPSDRNLAMVFQSYALYPHMTVRQNIATPLRMRRLGAMGRLPLIGRATSGYARINRAIEAEVRQAADMLQIGALLDRKPSQLSGGQRQRVALARALVRAPAAFLMDEPLSNLDAKLRAHMREELVTLHRRVGATFVYVTHDQVEAMSMSDRIALMDGGRILQLGTPSELYESPSSLSVAQFIGTPTINLIPAEVDARGHVHALGRKIGLKTTAGNAGNAMLGIRSESLRVGAEGWAARLVRSETHGADRYATFAPEADPQLRLVIRLPSGAALDLDPDGMATVGFDAQRVHLFAVTGERLDCSVLERALA